MARRLQGHWCMGAIKLPLYQERMDAVIAGSRICDDGEHVVVIRALRMSRSSRRAGRMAVARIIDAFKQIGLEEKKKDEK